MRESETVETVESVKQVLVHPNDSSARHETIRHSPSKMGFASKIPVLKPGSLRSRAAHSKSINGLASEALADAKIAQLKLKLIKKNLQSQSNIARKTEELANTLYEQKMAAGHDLEFDVKKARNNLVFQYTFCKLTKNCDALKSSCKSLSAQTGVDATKKELVTAKQNIQNAQKDLKAIEVESHTETNTLSVQNKEIKACQSRKKETQAQFNVANKELATTNRKVSAVQKEFMKLVNQRTKELDSLAFLKLEIESLKTLKQDTKAQKEATEGQLDLTNQKVDAAQSKLKVIVNESTISKNALSIAKREIKAIQTRKRATQVDETKKELATIKQQIDAAKVERDTILRNNTDVSSNLDQELETFETFKKESEAEMGVAKMELASTKESLAVAQKDVDKSKANLSAAVKFLTDLNQDITVLSQEVTALEVTFNNQEIESFQTPEEDTQGQINDGTRLVFQREIEHFQSLKQKIEVEAEVAREELGVTNQKLESAKMSLAFIEHQFSEDEFSMLALKREIEAIKNSSLNVHQGLMEFLEFCRIRKLHIQKKLESLRSSNLQKSSSENLTDLTPKSVVKDEGMVFFKIPDIEETRILKPLDMTGYASSFEAPEQNTLKAGISLLKKRFQSALGAGTKSKRVRFK